MLYLCGINFIYAMTTLDLILDKLTLLEAQVSQLNRRSAHTKNTLTLAEAASYLGCSKSYLYKLTSNGRIAYFKPGGKKAYFTSEALDEYLQQHGRKAIDQAAVNMAAADLVTYKRC